jgi:hypothetical protein
VSKWLLKCGCQFRSFPDNEDGPAEAFWDYCCKHLEKADSEGWERKEPDDFIERKAYHKDYYLSHRQTPEFKAAHRVWQRQYLERLHAKAVRPLP